MQFTKMHGAGNDFVVLDLRGARPVPDPATCRALADRNTGVGCDQILTIEDAAPGAVARYGIYNADGSASQQCGNGARCVAAWLVRDGAAGAGEFDLDSPAGRHRVTPLANGAFRIEMGRPEFVAARIPLRAEPGADGAYEVALADGTCRFGAVSMGNPHAVIEVADVARADLATAPTLQTHPVFPESVNVGFVQVVDPTHVRLRVYERGVGETLACGSGACAAAAVLMRRGRIARSVDVALPGGTLHIDWPDDTAPLSMAGPAAFVFEGTWLQ